MKGNNTINLNAASVMEAIQFWLNERMMKEQVKVTSVTGGQNGFVIAFEPVDEAERSDEE